MDDKGVGRYVGFTPMWERTNVGFVPGNWCGTVESIDIGLQYNCNIRRRN